MFKKKEFLIILILAGLVTTFSGYFLDFPLRITEPVFCIQMIGAGCYPFRILWANAILDLLFWFVVWVVVWWVVKRIRRNDEEAL